jgi:hypothetical protein
MKDAKDVLKAECVLDWHRPVSLNAPTPNLPGLPDETSETAVVSYGLGSSMQSQRRRNDLIPRECEVRLHCTYHSKLGAKTTTPPRLARWGVNDAVLNSLA